MKFLLYCLMVALVCAAYAAWWLMPQPFACFPAELFVVPLLIVLLCLRHVRYYPQNPPGTSLFDKEPRK